MYNKDSGVEQWRLAWPITKRSSVQIRSPQHMFKQPLPNEIKNLFGSLKQPQKKDKLKENLNKLIALSRKRS